MRAARSTADPDNKNEMVVIDASELKGLRQRLAVVENTTLQNRLNEGAKEPASLMSLVGDGQSKFKLAEHVIPLTALKKRVEGVEVGLEANGAAVDEQNRRLVETTRVLHETLMRELAKMVTREEFKVLADKHQALEEKVDKMIKDLVERLERMIREVDARVDDLNERVDGCEEKIETMSEDIQLNKAAIEAQEERVAQLEEIMPTKADRAELEAAIQELKDEMAKIDIDAIIAMVEKANERIDNMDKRADAIEDDVHDLREHVLRKEKEMEDLQLEKQIEQIRRELEEAKKGVLLKAQQRMDEIEESAENLKAQVTTSQGIIQVNRETIDNIQVILEEQGVKVGKGKKDDGTKDLIDRLTNEVGDLQKRYAEAAEKEAAGIKQMEDTENLMKEIQTKMHEIQNAKADWTMVDDALRIKADKDAVARDTEANQRAVDIALSTMNAGTQGIQQMLDKQTADVGSLEAKIGQKLDRDELSKLEKQLAETIGGRGGGGGDACSTDQSQAMYGAYGVSAEDAAVMIRPLNRGNCIACSRPIIKKDSTTPNPSLPLLPGSSAKGMTTTVAYVPMRRTSESTTYTRDGDSIVEVSDLNQTFRSAGGSHTSSRKQLGMTHTGTETSPHKPRRAQSATTRGRNGSNYMRNSGKPSELIGADGVIYHGTRPQSSRAPRSGSPMG